MCSPVPPSADRERAASRQGRDWTVQAADAIESAVGAVRDKTAIPLVTVARGLVFGVLALVMGLTILVLVTIALVRVLDVAVPGQVWSAYLLAGGIFTVVGGLTLRSAVTGQRRPKGDAHR